MLALEQVRVVAACQGLVGIAGDVVDLVVSQVLQVACRVSGSAELVYSTDTLNPKP